MRCKKTSTCSLCVACRLRLMCQSAVRSARQLAGVSPPHLDIICSVFCWSRLLCSSSRLRLSRSRSITSIDCCWAESFSRSEALFSISSLRPRVSAEATTPPTCFEPWQSAEDTTTHTTADTPTAASSPAPQSPLRPSCCRRQRGVRCCFRQCLPSCYTSAVTPCSGQCNCRSASSSATHVVETRTRETVSLDPRPC